MATIPRAAYNGKPAPIHTGDFDAVGYSTVLQTSQGFADLVGGSRSSSGQGAAAAQPGAPLYPAGFHNQVLALGALVVLLVYVDRRARG